MTHKPYASILNISLSFIMLTVAYREKLQTLNESAKNVGCLEELFAINSGILHVRDHITLFNARDLSTT